MEETTTKQKEEELAKWKRYLLYAIIGIVFIVIAYFFYRYYFSSGSVGHSSMSSYNTDSSSSSYSSSGSISMNANENEMSYSMSFDLDNWKFNVPNIAKDSILLNSIDNLSKYRHAAPEVFEDVILLIDSYCKSYYKTIEGHYPNSMKHFLLEKCQRLQTQAIFALHEFTKEFFSHSVLQYDAERQKKEAMHIREWTDTIKSIMKNYTVHIIRTMRTTTGQ
jgi:hypothetical protein